MGGREDFGWKVRFLGGGVKGFGDKGMGMQDFVDADTSGIIEKLGEVVGGGVSAIGFVVHKSRGGAGSQVDVKSVEILPECHIGKVIYNVVYTSVIAEDDVDVAVESGVLLRGEDLSEVLFVSADKEKGFFEPLEALVVVGGAKTDKPVEVLWGKEVIIGWCAGGGLAAGGGFPGGFTDELQGGLLAGGGVGDLKYFLEAGAGDFHCRVFSKGCLSVWVVAVIGGV